ncbi:MAG: extracellular catalytic domain type 1 short-chain-length polyhydroxyalkanoate depolymerase [Acidimicrobiales bacterium]
MRRGSQPGGARGFPAVVRAAAFLVVLAACGGSSSPPASGPGTSPPPVQQGQLTVGGDTRGYRVFVPPGVETPAPLVVALHGAGNSAESMVGTTLFDREAQAGGFIVAYPEGVQQSWNAGFCCAGAFASGVDDVAFLNRFLDRLEADYPIDPARVYVVGVSAGAMMAYRFACEQADRVAGVGSVAGSMPLEGCRPLRPVSAIEIHGTDDPLVPYGGGPVAPPEAVASEPVPPTPEVARRWADLDGCSGDPTTQSEGPVTTATWTECSAGTAVRLVSVEGGGHVWFAPGLGPANGAIDATNQIWSFFSGL